MLKHNMRPWRLVAATGIAMAAAVLIAGWRGLILQTAAALGVWAVAAYTMWRIPGLTGDVYGALCELVEAMTLLGFVLLLGGR